MWRRQAKGTSNYESSSFLGVKISSIGDAVSEVNSRIAMTRKRSDESSEEVCQRDIALAVKVRLSKAEVVGLMINGRVT